MTEQTQNIIRVANRIAGHVKDFCDDHKGKTFYIEELKDYVSARTSVAPASPDRILRLLRQAGEVDYTVVSRSQSLYRING